MPDPEPVKPDFSDAADAVIRNTLLPEDGQVPENVIDVLIEKVKTLLYNSYEQGGEEGYVAAQKNNPCADALEELWKEIILKYHPEYGDWEYPMFAKRHIVDEHEDIRKSLQLLLSHINELDSNQFSSSMDKAIKEAEMNLGLRKR